jgi:hypothetical protein
MQSSRLAILLLPAESGQSQGRVLGRSGPDCTRGRRSWDRAVWNCGNVVRGGQEAGRASYQFVPVSGKGSFSGRISKEI